MGLSPRERALVAIIERVIDQAQQEYDHGGAMYTDYPDELRQQLAEALGHA